MQQLPSTRVRRAYGAAGMIVLAVIITLGVASYLQKFTPAVRVKLQADRSGLLMEPGADVRLRGVPVGEVRSVAPDGAAGARLELALDPEIVPRIPAGSTARLAPSTVFGPKSVLLSAPAGPSSRPVQDGDVLQTDEVTVEINDVFQRLQDVLTTVQPEKLRLTLGALAQALDGRGDRLGGYLVQLNEYLRRFEPEGMDALATDVKLGADVAGDYARVAPDVLKIARNASITSGTLTKEQASLHALLLDFTRTSVNGEELLGRVERPLLTAVDALQPTTRLLAEYSPEFTCVIKGLNEAGARTKLLLGNQLPGIQGLAGFQPGHEGYKYPRDLPKTVTGLGPDCYELPYVRDGQIPTPRYVFDDGTKVYSGRTDAPSLGAPPVEFFSRLFGPFDKKTTAELKRAGVLPR